MPKPYFLCDGKEVWSRGHQHTGEVKGTRTVRKIAKRGHMELKKRKKIKKSSEQEIVTEGSARCP